MLLLASAGRLLAEPAITGLTVTPVPPRGLVLDYRISGAVAKDADAPLVVMATDGSRTYSAKALAGDTNCVNGAHRVFWDMATDGISADVTNGVVKVMHPLRYCVIDLSANAADRAVSSFSAEPDGGFDTDEYKTAKFVLKRIDAVAFVMGEDQTNESYRATLTQPFYMGLFEVTQKQWDLVRGSSLSSSDDAATPVGRVSYVDICGTAMSYTIPGYPVTATRPTTEELARLEAVRAAVLQRQEEARRSSFLFRLQEKTGQSLNRAVGIRLPCGDDDGLSLGRRSGWRVCVVVLQTRRRRQQRRVKPGGRSEAPECVGLV